MRNLTLKGSDWDSEQLGIRCGLIDAIGFVGNDMVLAARINKMCASNKDIKFITIKLPGDRLKAVNALIKSGASLIDVEVTFMYLNKEATVPVRRIPVGLSVVFCKECESAPLIPLAREMRLSRFFNDPHIPSRKAIKLWKASIKGHCEGFADEILIAHIGNKTCGMVTIRRVAGESIFLHIVGVLKEFQGKGIAAAMLRKIIERFAEDHKIYVETQLGNIRAQAAYQNAGFRHCDFKYVMHYWN